MNYPRRALCPCCLFPTLNANGGFEICAICWWEDDGQNDQDAGEVRGGPNSSYSLTDARKNFTDHGHMYDKDRGIQVVEQPSAARRELMDYLRSIRFDPKRTDSMRLSELLSAEDHYVRNVNRQTDVSFGPMTGAESTLKNATTTMKSTKSHIEEAKGACSPSQRSDTITKQPNDWRGEMLARIRMLIKQADPEVVEEVKWRKPSNAMRGVPVWSHDGIICTGETYKNAVKLTFAKGASLENPSGLFNSSLEGNTRRAIDFHEGDKIDEKALQALIRAAVALNMSARPAARPRPRPVRSPNRPKSG